LFGNSFRGVGKAKQTALLLAACSTGIATRHIVLAYDGRYWLETETYDSRFDMHDWELEVITTAHADWLEKRIKVQSELIRTALIDYQTLLTIQEKVTKEKL
jgi:hypothetical protein